MCRTSAVAPFHTYLIFVALQDGVDLHKVQRDQSVGGSHSFGDIVRLTERQAAPHGGARGGSDD